MLQNGKFQVTKKELQEIQVTDEEVQKVMVEFSSEHNDEETDFINLPLSNQFLKH